MPPRGLRARTTQTIRQIQIDFCGRCLLAQLSDASISEAFTPKTSLSIEEHLVIRLRWFGQVTNPNTGHNSGLTQVFFEVGVFNRALHEAVGPDGSRPDLRIGPLCRNQTFQSFLCLPVAAPKSGVRIMTAFRKGITAAKNPAEP